MALSSEGGTLSRSGDSEPLMTSDDTLDTSPAVSPDGSELAFTRDRVAFTTRLAEDAGSPEAAPGLPDRVFHLSWARR